MSVTAYPLQWPPGWPRTPDWKRGRWPNDAWSFSRARDELVAELARLEAKAVIISTNYEIGQRTNLPLKSGRQPEDKGIAVYFTLKGKPMAMASDRYTSAEGNMRSLTLAIEGMRQLERHGGGFMMEKAFAGFEALPPPGTSSSQYTASRSCYQILGVAPNASADEIKAAYRNRAAAAHPDSGGSHDAMAELNAARDAALSAVRAA